ncbi:hypothetical protein [Trinickia dinghuensis]|uniref:ABM domain-containing protein n=1 Tax=Trinickia dinghuensis TaxID=2291023 RepID=A0A3D8JZ46_9BURK|nr:hypothetical protein [Trinickia dinghuensis]RDU98443.1 hypothetical protein DWV00_14180 [Trinickia dinghuensis]
MSPMSNRFNPADHDIRLLAAGRVTFASPAALERALPSLIEHAHAVPTGTLADVYRDVDADALLFVAAWRVVRFEAAERTVVDAIAHAIEPVRADASPAWIDVAVPGGAWTSGRSGPGECLVLVRQPLEKPNAIIQTSWIDKVLLALNGDAEPPDGLISANFFATHDEASVLNFARWTSADAHREALARGHYGQHDSIGASPLWRVTREHPGIRADHEVCRYEPVS